MQVEHPHAPPASLREFIRQYAMIVLSILTALALERAVIDLHDRGAARDSRVRIEAEIAGNLAELKTALARNTTNARDIEEVFKALIALMKAGNASDAALLGVVTPAFPHFSVALPSFQHDAWYSAQTDQSASHLPAADLRRYDDIYTSERDAAAQAELLLGGEWLTRAAELRVDIALGKVDARSFANSLVRFLVASKQIGRSQQDLVTLMVTGHAPASPGGT